MVTRCHAPYLYLANTIMVNPLSPVNSIISLKFNAFLTHWGRMTLICIGKLTIIGSDNGLSPGRRQAIIWTIAGLLLIGPLVTNFSKVLIEIQTFSFKKVHFTVSSAKWRPFYLSLSVLKKTRIYRVYIVNIMSADDLVLQGVRTPAVVAIT